MKITMTRFNKQNKVISSKTGRLTSQKTIQQDLFKTIVIAYNNMLNNPDCSAVTITLRKEVK